MRRSAVVMGWSPEERLLGLAPSVRPAVVLLARLLAGTSDLAGALSGSRPTVDGLEKRSPFQAYSSRASLIRELDLTATNIRMIWRGISRCASAPPTEIHFYSQRLALAR